MNSPQMRLYSASEFDAVENTCALAQQLIRISPTARVQLFRHQIPMGCCTKNQYVLVKGTLAQTELLTATRTIRPMIRPYGEFPQLPLAGDGDLPDGYMLVLPKFYAYTTAKANLVRILATFHVRDNGEEDAKHLVVPADYQVTCMPDACMLIEQMRVVKTYLMNYKNKFTVNKYLTPMQFDGFSFG